MSRVAALNRLQPFTSLLLLLGLLGCADESEGLRLRADRGGLDAAASQDGSMQQGGVDASSPLQSAADASSPMDGGIEACNGRDDDGDDRIDEGATCFAANAISKCESGVCTLTECYVEFSDCDLDESNGCEVRITSNPLHCGGCGATCSEGLVCYCGQCKWNNFDLGSDEACLRCVASAADDRQCDLRDEDCDGRVDEDVDLNNDRDNCGMCARACPGDSICRDGQCQCDGDAGADDTDAGCRM